MGLSAAYRKACPPCMHFRRPGVCTRSGARRERASPPRNCAAGRTFLQAPCKGFADVTRRGNSAGPRAAKRDRMDNAAAIFTRRKHWFPDPSAGKRGRRRPLGFPRRALTGAGSPPDRPRQMRVFAPSVFDGVLGIHPSRHCAARSSAPPSPERAIRAPKLARPGDSRVAWVQPCGVRVMIARPFS